MNSPKIPDRNSPPFGPGLKSKRKLSMLVTPASIICPPMPSV
jgi:hypothetical protein